MLHIQLKLYHCHCRVHAKNGNSSKPLIKRLTGKMSVNDYVDKSGVGGAAVILAGYTLVAAAWVVRTAKTQRNDTAQDELVSSSDSSSKQHLKSIP